MEFPFYENMFLCFLKQIPHDKVWLQAAPILSWLSFKVSMD